MIVIGRKGWLFCDTRAGAQARANLYSLLQTYRANGVNTYEYLKAFFAALPKATTADDYDALLPWRFKPTDRSSRPPRPSQPPLPCHQSVRRARDGGK